ncbi:unnamed protein product [Orchesella dallaii]|uniref:Upstream activation factor subunit spp27 n=1 Tax=Orchesella dallaii TaxID=48710 RepID=A0ABP1S5M6_9HEXA
MADSAKLKKTIGEILDDADLTTITAKKVRQQLETKLKMDLTDRKKEIDTMVMEILEKKQEQDQDNSEEEEASEDEGKKAAGGKRRKKAAADSESEDDYVPEKKAKGKKAADSDDSGDDWAKKRKSASASKGAAAGKKKGGGGGTGFTKILKLSPELSSVMGQPEMARHEVVKKIWSIIKEKNLYDPKNKQFAICNEELLPVMGVKRFRTFGMMKHLKNHFIN